MVPIKCMNLWFLRLAFFVMDPKRTSKKLVSFSPVFDIKKLLRFHQDFCSSFEAKVVQTDDLNLRLASEVLQDFWEVFRSKIAQKTGENWCKKRHWPKVWKVSEKSMLTDFRQKSEKSEVVLKFCVNSLKTLYNSGFPGLEVLSVNSRRSMSQELREQPGGHNLGGGYFAWTTWRFGQTSQILRGRLEVLREKPEISVYPDEARNSLSECLKSCVNSLGVIIWEEAILRGQPEDLRGQPEDLANLPKIPKTPKSRFGQNPKILKIDKSTNFRNFFVNMFSHKNRSFLDLFWDSFGTEKHAKSCWRLCSEKM